MTGYGEKAKDYAVGTIVILGVAWLACAVAVGSIVLAQRIAEAVQ